MSSPTASTCEVYRGHHDWESHRDLPLISTARICGNDCNEGMCLNGRKETGRTRTSPGLTLPKKFDSVQNINSLRGGMLRLRPAGQVQTWASQQATVGRPTERI